MMNLLKLEMDIFRKFLEIERLLHIVRRFWLNEDLRNKKKIFKFMFYAIALVRLNRISPLSNSVKMDVASCSVSVEKLSLNEFIRMPKVFDII